jgi:hypothetical protein
MATLFPGAEEKLNPRPGGVLKAAPMRSSLRACAAMLSLLAAMVPLGCLDEGSSSGGGAVVDTCVPACKLGDACRGGLCVSEAAALTGVGAACTTPADCGGGMCLQSATLPQGYCSKNCGGGVLSIGSVCPAGSQCTRLSEAASVCLKQCASAADCRNGYVCTTDRGPTAVCAPRCTADTDCTAPRGCNTTTGLCEVGAKTAEKIGGGCTAPTQCASQKCVTEMGSMAQFPGGYCVAGCTAADEDKPCPGGDGICIGLPDSSGNTGYVCLGGCTTGVDCRRDYMCSADAQIKTADGSGICIPRCEHFTCNTGFTCDTTVGICSQGGQMSGVAGVVDEPLGSVTVGSAPADFKTVPIKVESGEVSFTLVGSASVASVEIGLAKVIAPNGKVVFDRFDPLNSDFMEPFSSFSGSTVAMYPNAPRVTIVPGTYNVTIRGEGTTAVKLNVLHKRQTGVLQGGSLPLVFWFTKQNFLTATSAKTDPAFQQAVKVFTQIYGSVGITLGPLTYADLPEPAATNYAVIDDLNKLEGLFATANASPIKGLHFFMIEQFNLEGGAGIIGISGGIPGPPAFPGLPHGGVAVGLDGLSDPGLLAETMAHEGGHFLGLYHTTERDGLSFDPLVDTEECPSTQDRNGDKLVTGAECGGFGSDNLMFWSTAPVPQRKLTSDQRFVLLRNPVVQ